MFVTFCGIRFKFLIIIIVYWANSESSNLNFATVVLQR